MNRYLVGLVLVLGIGYWGYTWWRDDLAATEARIAREARQQAQKQSVADMTRRANAIADWPATLAGAQKMRTGPIMTAELQKLWLGDRPVLFIGNVQDVAINKDGTYQVTLEYNWIDNQPMLLGSDIRVSLSCHESIATKLLETAKANKGMGIRADTAVVAKIHSIERFSEKSDEGSTTTVLSGIGNCVDTIQLGELSPKGSKR